MSNSKKKIIVVNPHTQHAERVAYALYRNNLLDALVTGFVYSADSLLAKSLAMLPTALGAGLQRVLGKRKMRLLPTAFIRCQPLLHILALCLLRTSATRRLGTWLQSIALHRFDQFALHCVQSRSPQAVICFDDSAASIFRHCKERGITTILDQSIGHLSAAAKVFEAECKRHPSLSEYLPSEPTEKIDRAVHEATLADYIFCPSTYVQETLLALGIDQRKVVLIPYGVDTDFFRPATSTPHSKFVILYVGLITPRKGVHYLVEAFQQAQLPNAELLLIGSGPDTWITSLLKTPGVRHIPHLPRDEILKAYQAASIFAFPSLHEGSALVTYEALACGLPLVTTFNSGSVITDGVEGLLVPSGEIVILAEKLKLLYEDQGLRQDLSIAARARAEQFTWEHYYSRIEQFFSENHSNATISTQDSL